MRCGERAVSGRRLDARPAWRLHGYVLPGEIGKGLVGRDRQYGDAGLALFVVYYFSGPVRGSDGAVILSCADHQPGSGLIGLHPRFLRVLGEGWPSVGTQRRDQGLADCVVHRRLYGVLAVVMAELA